MLASLTLFLAQAQPVSSNFSLGEWLGIIAALLSAGALVWRTAVVATKMGQIEGFTARELIRINERLDVIEGFVGEARKTELNDVRWATQTTTRLDAIEREIRDINEERRHGPADRRDPPN